MSVQFLQDQLVQVSSEQGLAVPRRGMDGPSRDTQSRTQFRTPLSPGAVAETLRHPQLHDRQHQRQLAGDRLRNIRANRHPPEASAPECVSAPVQAN